MNTHIDFCRETLPYLLDKQRSIYNYYSHSY